jgi:hypothetical protein
MTYALGKNRPQGRVRLRVRPVTPGAAAPVVSPLHLPVGFVTCECRRIDVDVDDAFCPVHGKR